MAPSDTASDAVGSSTVPHYDEFGLFHENAAELGLSLATPPVVQRRFVPIGDRSLSALVWGVQRPRLVLLHGGAQNAHTWDSVALALGMPLVAVDLPGHGHSADRRADGPIVDTMAGDVEAVVRALAPDADMVVGMSLGGLVAIALAARAPELVRQLVLVDITPGVTAAKASPIVAFVQGPESFATFDEILARTVEHNPGRSVSSLRRGVLHNAVQRPDGGWVWRHARPHAGRAGPMDIGAVAALWEPLGALTVPVTLVRGTRPQSVVTDDDEAELRRRLPNARVEHVDAGHSVQGDAPLVLAALLAELVDGPAG